MDKNNSMSNTETNKVEWEEEFDKEWEKSNTWGGGRFGSLSEVNDEYNEFTPNPEGIKEFIRELLD